MVARGDLAWKSAMPLVGVQKKIIRMAPPERW
jgi:pyruvate kinase